MIDRLLNGDPYLILPAIGVFILCLLLLKPLLWWLFSFDAKVSTLLHQKKSSEVRVGQIAETLAPITDGFPVDIRKPGTSTVFIGQPVDYIHFDPEEGITFIEVKSGGAKLSVNQKKIRALVDEGRVSWADFRLK